MKFVTEWSWTVLLIWRYSSSVCPASYSLLWGTVPHKLTDFWIESATGRVARDWKARRSISENFLPHSISSLHDSSSLQVIPIIGCDSLFSSSARKDTDFLPVLIPRLPQLLKFSFQFFQNLCKKIPFIKFSLLLCLSCIGSIFLLDSGWHNTPCLAITHWQFMPYYSYNDGSFSSVNFGWVSVYSCRRQSVSRDYSGLYVLGDGVGCIYLKRMLKWVWYPLLGIGPYSCGWHSLKEMIFWSLQDIVFFSHNVICLYEHPLSLTSNYVPNFSLKGKRSILRNVMHLWDKKVCNLIQFSDACNWGEKIHLFTWMKNQHTPSALGEKED